MATIALKTLPEFIGLSATQYAALKTAGTLKANALYFVYDAGVNGLIYRGSNVYGETIRYVSSVPTANDALLGVVYFNTTSGIAYVKSGNTMTPIGVTTTSVIDDSDDTQNPEVPNIGAVKNYVKAKVATVFTYRGVVATVDDLPEPELTEDTVAVAGKDYYARAGEAGAYTYTKQTVVVGTTDVSAFYELPKVGDLYNVTTGEDGTSAEYAWTDMGEGVYKWEKLGSTIDYSIFMQKVSGATSGHVLQVDASGAPYDGGISIATTSAIPEVESATSTVLVNELQAATISSTLNTSITNASSALNTSITNASSALDSSITAASSALDTSITNASSALDSKISDLGVDAVHKGDIDGTTDANEVMVVGGSGASVEAVATGKYLGGSAFAASSADVTLATEAGVSGYVTPISSALNTSITNASSALDSALTAASSALASSLTAASSALDADKMDKVAKNSGGIILISKDDGNSELTGYITGSGAIVTASASDKTLATEYAVVALINSMAWQTVEE